MERRNWREFFDKMGQGNLHRIPAIYPCSRGCFARSCYRMFLFTISSLFQSLFSWMFRSKFAIDNNPILIMLFQSLFSWMFRSKTPSERKLYNRLWFQSLFSWMFRSKKRAHNRETGKYTVSILVLVDVSLEAIHPIWCTPPSPVSILVLVDVSLEGILRNQLLLWSFVSILVLVDVSLEAL